MLRNLVAACAVIQMLSATTLVIAAAADFGTAEEAKAMLERADPQNLPQKVTITHSTTILTAIPSYPIA